MSKKPKSKDWFARHASCTYVKEAKKQGYKSRAAFKLKEIAKTHKIFVTAKSVLELGAAPGGWTQVIMQELAGKGTIVAVDLLTMQNFADVCFIQGDITDSVVTTRVSEANAGKRFDLILSDMAPNLTGTKVSDQAKMFGLADLVLDVATQQLNKDGTLLIKLFQGQGFTEYLGCLRKVFKKVQIIKPKASRDYSTEVYGLATGFQPPQTLTQR